MPRYRVEINGRNFSIEMEGGLAKHGFYTWRVVEAADASSAEDAAIRMLREKQDLRDLVRNPAEDPPLMDVTEIVGWEDVDGAEDATPGLVWYPENPRRWWQFWRR